MIDCKIYENKDTTSCKECRNNATLITLSNQDKFCYPDPGQNCSSIDTTKLQTNQLQCNSCIKDFYLNSSKTLENVNFCVKIKEIENCLSYNIQ